MITAGVGVMDVRKRHPGDQMWAALWQVVPDRLPGRFSSSGSRVCGVLAGVIATRPTAVYRVSFDSIQVPSSVPGGGMQKQRRCWSVLGGQGRAEAEVVLIHTEGSRKNRNSPDP